MAAKSNTSSTPSKRPQFAIAMLVMAAVVVGLTVMIAVRGGGTGGGQSNQANNSAPRESKAQEVRGRTQPLLEAGAYAQARDLAMAYVSQHPMDTDVRPLLAEAQIGLGELQQAQATLVGLLNLAPTQAQGNWLMARLLKLKSDDRYIKFLKRAADGEDARAEMAAEYGREMLQRDDLPQAQAYLQAAMGRGDRSAATLAAMGALDLRLGEPAKAVDLLRESLKSQPRNADGWELLVRAYRASGRADLAAKAIDEGLKHQQSGQLLMEKAILLARAGDKSAAETFEQAAAHAGFETLGYVSAARAWTAQGRYAQAMYCIDQVMDRPKSLQQLCGWIAWCVMGAQGAAAPLAADPLAIIQLKSQIEDLRFGEARR